MARSEQKTISFSVGIDEVEEWEDRAESQGLSRSAWVRRHVRAGMRLWDAAGDFNQEEFDRIFEGEHEYSSSGKGTTKSHVKDLIERNLSVTEPIPEAELQEVIIEVMNETLYELQQEGKIENVPGEGYRQLKNHE